jgi:hypothetical protein
MRPAVTLRHDLVTVRQRAAERAERLPCAREVIVVATVRAGDPSPLLVVDTLARTGDLAVDAPAA